jgi:hypothetical protein
MKEEERREEMADAEVFELGKASEETQGGSQLAKEGEQPFP